MPFVVEDAPPEQADAGVSRGSLGDSTDDATESLLDPPAQVVGAGEKPAALCENDPTSGGGNDPDEEYVLL